MQPGVRAEFSLGTVKVPAIDFRCSWFVVFAFLCAWTFLQRCHHEAEQPLKKAVVGAVGRKCSVRGKHSNSTVTAL
jgi:hypothetical protein